MEHKQIECSFYFALHGTSRMSTSSPCLRKGTWWGFGDEWNGTLEPNAIPNGSLKINTMIWNPIVILTS